MATEGQNLTSPAAKTNPTFSVRNSPLGSEACCCTRPDTWSQHGFYNRTFGGNCAVVQQSYAVWSLFRIHNESESTALALICS